MTTRYQHSRTFTLPVEPGLAAEEALRVLREVLRKALKDPAGVDWSTLSLYTLTEVVAPADRAIVLTASIDSASSDAA